MYGRTRLIPNKKNEVNNQIKIHNKFDLVVKDTDTGEINKYTAYNVILNSVKDKLFVNLGTIWAVHFGSDTTPADPTQTGLITEFGEANFRASSIDRVDTDTIAYRLEAYIGTTTFVGKKFAEVGIKCGRNANWFNRALFTDSNGNPITIDKTDTMEITIYCSVYISVKLKKGQCIGNPSGLVGAVFASGDSSRRGHIYGLSGGYWMVTDYLTKDQDQYKLRAPWARVQPDQMNGCYGIGYVDAYGIQTYIPGSDMVLPPVKDKALGTGNGANKIFNPPWPMKSIEVRKNGIIVPPSEYVYRPLCLDTACGSLTPYRNSIMPINACTNMNTMNWSGAVLYAPKEWTYFETIDGDTVIDGFNTWDSIPGIIIEVSNDGVNWVAKDAIWSWGSSGYSKLRVWNNHTAEISARTIIPNLNASKSLVFKTAPENGSVLTFSGTPYVIPKDTEHVIDGETVLDYSGALD